MIQIIQQCIFYHQASSKSIADGTFITWSFCILGDFIRLIPSYCENEECSSVNRTTLNIESKAESGTLYFVSFLEEPGFVHFFLIQTFFEGLD